MKHGTSGTLHNTWLRNPTCMIGSSRWKSLVTGFIQLNYIPEFVHFIIRIKSNTLECRKENEWNLEKIVFVTIVPLELDLEDQFRSGNGTRLGMSVLG